MMSLHYADYIVFGLLLLISALVGPFYAWRDRNKPATSESYFTGNRGLHVIPTAASLFASFWSAIALVGIPAELYTGGAKFFMSSVGQAIGIVIGAYLVVPMIFNLRLISSFEYFELRFKSKALRKVGTFLNIFANCFYVAVVTFAPCIALEAVSNIPLWASVIGTAVITMIYTVLGGIKAVVLVDLIQAIAMLGGVLVVIIIGYAKIDGGFSKVMEVATEAHRLDFFDLNPNPTNTYNFWVMVIPPIIADAGLYASSQASVQRFSGLPSVKQAIWSVLAIAPQILFLKVMLFFLALVMFAHYQLQGCDPLKGGIIHNPNQLTTFYIADVANYPGIVGLWFAALFSGSLSSMSTGYNSAAACIWEDLLKDHLKHRLTPRGVAITLKIISLCLGAFTCILAISFKFLSGSVIKLSASTVGIFGAALYICFFCGAMFPFINTFGTIFGMICASALIIFLAGGQMYFKLGNEQYALPSRVDNCPAMLMNLVAAGKLTPTAGHLAIMARLNETSNTGNVTAALTTSLLLLTSSPAVLLPGAISPSSSLVSHTNGTSFLSNQSLTILPEVNPTPEMNMIDDKDMKDFMLIKPNDLESKMSRKLTEQSNKEGHSSGDGFITGMLAEVTTETVMLLNTAANLSNETSIAVKSAADKLPPVLKFLFSMSYFLFSFLSLITGILIAIPISLCAGGAKSARHVNPKYLVVKNCFYVGDDDEDDDEIRAESWYMQEKKGGDATGSVSPNKKAPPNRRIFEDTKDYAAAQSLMANNNANDTGNGDEKPPIPPTPDYVYSLGNEGAADSDEEDAGNLHGKKDATMAVANAGYSRLDEMAKSGGAANNVEMRPLVPPPPVPGGQQKQLSH